MFYFKTTTKIQLSADKTQANISWYHIQNIIDRGNIIKTLNSKDTPQFTLSDSYVV